MIPASFFSQNTWPRRILISNDTVICITPFQLKQANLLFVDGDFYKEMSDTLRILAVKQQRAINAEQNLVTNYENQLQLKNQIISSFDTVTIGYKYLIKKNDRQIKWLKVQRTTLVVVVAATLAKIFIFK